MKVKYLILLALSLGLNPLSAQQQQPAEASAEQKATAPLQQDAALLTGKLDNGMKYIIRHTNEPAGRGSLRLFVNTGSLNEDESTSGISHFIEHLVFNGSKHFKRGELIPAMQMLGLGFGGDANAYTSLLQTVYQLDMPNLEDKTVDFALTIMRDFADGALLEDDAIDHERGIVISELKSRDSASYRAGIEALRFLCPGTRVPDFMPIGKEEVIRNAPYELVRQYYRDNYLPQRMTVIATGDFKPEEMEKLIIAKFADMKDRGNPDRPAIGVPSDMGPAETIIPNPEQANTQISLAVTKPWQHKADTLEQRLNDLPLQLACMMLQRRYQRMTRQEGCPFLAAGAGKEEVFNCVEVFGLDITAHPQDWKAALNAAEQELRRAATYGFSEQELKEATAELMGGSQAAIDTWNAVTSDSMADGLVAHIANGTAMTAPTENARAIRLGLSQIAQQPELCQKALTAAYEQDRIRIAMTGAVPEGVTTTDLRNAYTAAKDTAVTPPADEKVTSFAYDHIGEPGNITKQEYIEDIGVTTLTLSNGVRVNLKSVDYSPGKIAVIAAVDGGFLRLKQPGLAGMADAVMDGGGLEAHSAEELRRILAGRNVGLHFSANNKRFLFTGEASKNEADLQCKLLAAAILHPGFRSEGEMQLRRRTAAIYNKLETTPQGVQQMQGNRVLFGNDPRFTTPTREELEAHDTAEVKEALTPWLENGAMEVTIVGDFKTGDIIPVILNSFGAMPTRRADFAPLTAEEQEVSFRPWGQRAFLRCRSNIDRTLVTQVRPAGDGRDKHRSRRLSVLSSIVREKLFDGLRAELGESYSPSARLSANSDFENAAYFTTTSAGVKSNRIKVNSAMDAILADIGRGNLTQDDLDCALRPFIASCEKSLRDTSFWASSLTDLQSDPDRLGLIRDLVSDVRSISLEEINKLAKEVFGHEQINYIFTVPADFTPETEEQTDDCLKPEEQKADTPKPEEKAQAAVLAPYAVLISMETALLPEWKEVALTLKKKRQAATVIALPDLSEASMTAALRKSGARYAALVSRPEELGYEVVNNLNRAARAVDDDPWGDCLTGIITGTDAAAARDLAADDRPLTIKRLLGTTNVDAARFEHSCCITDWTNSPVLEQSGYAEPVTTPCKENALKVFAHQLGTQKPQLLVTSSHATQFNLEMPFSKGLIFPDGRAFHLLPTAEMFTGAFTQSLTEAVSGNTGKLEKLAQSHESIPADGERRVWLASGNCLLGNVSKSPRSMVPTALSGYGFRQMAGYTVPSWFGRSGWGSLSLFMGNTDGTSLSEAVFLNNQFLLHDTMQLDARLLKMRFNDAQFITPMNLYRQIRDAGLVFNSEQMREALGLIHDRDTFAFYGDPAWRAAIDSEHTHAPFRISWQDQRTFTITANSDTTDRCAVWLPDHLSRDTVKGCNAPDAVFTNDFILFPKLELKAGESRTVTIE